MSNIRTADITLQWTINAKCINCRHMSFPDTLEDVDYGTCGLTNKEVKEADYCDEWSIYNFWDDCHIDMALKEIKQEITK